MKKYILTIAATTLLLATSCTQKAVQTTINGQVRTYGTEDAIKHPPVKVQIVEEEYFGGGVGGSNTYTPIAETWTDQNGHFSLSHKLYKDGNKYFLAVDDETVKTKYGYYAPSYGSISRPERQITTIGGTFTKNFYLVAYGWVKFNINVSSHDSDDYFAYNVGGGGSERFYGNVSTSRIWDFGGNITHDVAFTTFVNGEYKFWQDEIFVPAFDTTEYNINL